MTYNFRFRPQAATELRDALAWYYAANPALEPQFFAAVEELLAAICQTPLAYLRYRGEIRRGLVNKFPYRILFRIIDDEIIVIAVLHTRRHPARGISRH